MTMNLKGFAGLRQKHLSGIVAALSMHGWLSGGEASGGHRLAGG